MNSYLGYKIAGAISVLGILIAGYLTLLDFTEASAPFCAANSNCDLVRSSRYANFFGVPVALIGLLGYISILLTIVLPLRRPIRRLVFLILSTIGFIFSLYLVFVQLFVLNSICQWCMISFALISSIFLIAIIRNGLTYYFKFKFTFAFLVLAFAISFSMYACSSDIDEQSYEAQLAKHLSEEGAVMYGAYWCPHCSDQKQLFGKAFEYIEYVECDAKGPNPNPKLCDTKKIKAYPTWEINGRFYEGNIPLESLANLSGF